MQILPKTLETAIEAFSSLPGVGPRTAERYAYYVLRHDKHAAGRLADSLINLHDGIKLCPKTFALINASEDISSLYSDPSRDKALVAVVAEVAGDEADYRADACDDDGGGEADDQGGAGADHQLGEDVAAEVGSTEQVGAAGRDAAREVAIGGEQDFEGIVRREHIAEHSDQGE